MVFAAFDFCGETRGVGRKILRRNHRIAGHHFARHAAAGFTGLGRAIGTTSDDADAMQANRGPIVDGIRAEREATIAIGLTRRNASDPSLWRKRNSSVRDRLALVGYP